MLKDEALGMSGKFGTEEEHPVVPGVEENFKSRGCGLPMSFVSVREPVTLPSTEGILEVEVAGDR